jgi:hypothetical protein
LREFLKSAENRELVFKILFELTGGWRSVERVKCPRCGKEGNYALTKLNSLVFWHWERDEKGEKKRKFCYIGKLRKVRERINLEIAEKEIQKILEEIKRIKKEKEVNISPPNATKGN